MTVVVLAALLVAHPWSGEEGVHAEVRVTASDVAGSADPSLANALAQALVDAGLAAAPDRHSGVSGDCRDDCLQVAVRKTDQGRFVIEVRGRGDVALEPVRLEPTASSFDEAHALAIEVELLAERMHPPRRHRLRVATSGPASSLAPASAPTTASPSPRLTVAAELGPVTPDTGPPPAAMTRASDLTSESPPATPSIRAVPIVHQQPPPQAMAAEPHVSLDVAALVLAGTSGGLLMPGSTLGVRLRLSRRLDARASICFLRPQNVEQQGIRYHLELLPLGAVLSAQIPGVPGLGAGGGVEGLLVTGERNGDQPSSWSLGPIARVEYRHAVRSFTLISSLQATTHPAWWQRAPDGRPRVTMPLVTVAASLGLEFNVF